ncbi:hypothetical protein BC834DRAFT_849309 [Gloeopeniophorella convolvens]|nr:hypothetical protein BC834DRAFT_849309 [Gloeopeniophorella convolvens]
MINHVTRWAVLHTSPFLNNFQEAAARAYLRVRASSSLAAASQAGPSAGTSLRTGNAIIMRSKLRRSLSVNFRSDGTTQPSHPRRRSSQIPSGSAPILPVFSTVPFQPRGESEKKHTVPNLKGRRRRPPEYALTRTPPRVGTAGAANISDFDINFIDPALASPSVEQDAIPVSPEMLAYHVIEPPSPRTPCTRYPADLLTRRLLHLYASSSESSIPSLVSYHNSFPDMQSVQSYNLLLRLAIRHSAFGTAHALLRSMRVSRVQEDVTTWKLCVRLLVREGRWPEAYSLAVDAPKEQPRAPFASGGVPVSVWAELLGTAKRRAFRGKVRTRDPGMASLARYRQVVRLLTKFGVWTKRTPPFQATYASVRLLLQMGQRDAAREVTARFLATGARGLRLPLVHLVIAPTPKRRSLATYYHALRDLHGFRAVCPALKPNSTTLFLLLGHLKRAKQCGSIGSKLVQWFRRQWGHSIVSSEVEIRLLDLAVKEKRVKLMKQTMTGAETRRKIRTMGDLEREVLSGGATRRELTHRPELRITKAGTGRARITKLSRRASKVAGARRPRRPMLRT